MGASKEMARRDSLRKRLHWIWRLSSRSVAGSGFSLARIQEVVVPEPFGTAL
jgi:hypothetical protein